ncbi:phage holin family protein [Kytococcus sp. Marseille-QA3725]
MSNFFLKIVVNGVALWVASLVVPGIALGDDTGSLGERLLSILLVALLFGVINALVKPIVKFFSFPLIVLTLGLFSFVVNALMLWLLSWAAGSLGLDFHVETFFWAAILGAVVVSCVAMLLEVLVPDAEDDRALSTRRR